MKNFSFVIALAALVFLGLIWRDGDTVQSAATAQPIKVSQLATTMNTQRSQAYARLPLRFEANQGQTDKRVRFLSRNQGYNFFVTAEEAVLQLQPVRPKPQRQKPWEAPVQESLTYRDQVSTILRFKLLNANPAPEIRGLAPLPGRANYFFGKDQNRWRTGVTQYAKVEYRDVYPGINLLWYGNQQQLEYDFVLQPHADPGKIKLAFTGAQKMQIVANGDLVLTTRSGEVRQRKPIAYQDVNGRRQNVEVRYVIYKQRQVGFELGSYDPNKVLVIDPVLVYSSFFGGGVTGSANLPGVDFAQDAVIDDEGNLYLTGSTTAVDFPIVQAVQPTIASVDGCCDDVFITKLSPTGVVFSTYLGGSVTESGNAITLDKDGNVIISGHTLSPNFPTTPGAFRTYANSVPQAFATKLDRDGSLVFSTLLGGLGQSYGYTVTTDDQRNVYVAGATRAYNFPVVNAYQSEKALGRHYDGFITKLDPQGTGVIYSTFLGGDGEDGINAIKVDQAGNMYVAGATSSFDFPVKNAIQDYWVYDYDSNKGGRLSDVFITKLSADGQSLVYSTYLGNYDIDYATDLEIDNTGNAYLTGATVHGLAGNTDYPAVSRSPAREALVRQSREGDIFIVKLDATGTKPLFVNYFGREDNLFFGSFLALDATGLIYVAGGSYRSAAEPFTITADAFQVQAPPNSNGTAFLTIFDPTKQGAASVRYSTLLAGSGGDGAVAVVLDKQANIYLVGHSTYDPLRGGTNDFPILNPPYKSTFGPVTDVFVAKFSALLAPPPTNTDTIAPTINVTAPTTGTEFTTTSPKITISGTATDNVGVKAVTWTVENNLSQNLTGTNNWTIPNLYLQRGKNKITVTAADAAGNLSSVTLTVTYQAEYLIETYAGYPYRSAPDDFWGDGGAARVARFREPFSIALDQSGNLFVGDIRSTRIRKIAPSGIITHVAGVGGSGFAGDGGPAIAARLSGGGTLATDKNGNLFIADPGNHRVRKVTPEGIITTIAGSGPVCPADCVGQHSGDGGPATQGQLKGPLLIAVDDVGNLYIADTAAQRIRKVNPAGIITTIAGKGTRGNTGDGGLAIEAEIDTPSAMAVDGQGNLYFSQPGGDGGDVIRKITPDGKINRIAGTGKASYGDESGPALATNLSVRSMALDRVGNLYLIDLLASRLRRINTSGNIETLAGHGEYAGFQPGDGDAATAAWFHSPYGIAVDAKGNIYVLEVSGERIRRLFPANGSDATAPVITLTTPASQPVTTSFPIINLRGNATDNEGVFQVKWSNERGGSGQALGLNAWQVDNVALQAGLNTITITATDAAGNAGSKQIFVEYQLDTASPTISITSPTTATYNTTSIFVNLRGTASDNAGVAEIQWHTDRGDNGYATGTASAWNIDNLVVREGSTNLKVTATDYAGNSSSATLTIIHTPEYLMYTYAGGNFNLTPDGNGRPAMLAQLLDPQGMARDGLGNIYVSQGQFNSIRKISPNGFISTFKEMPYPGPLATDQQGNLYVLDPRNYLVFKFSPEGQMSIVAGNGDYGPVGENVPALSTSLAGASSIKLDQAGNLYLTNYLTHRIYKVNAQTGIINAIVGNGKQGFSGDGGAATAAQLSNPIAMAFDQQGNLYFADQNKLIRRVASDGIIRTIAGMPNLGQGFSGDGGLATAAQFYNPLDLAIDNAGNLFIADAGNSCVRRIKPDGTISTIAGINPYVPEQKLAHAQGEYNAAIWGTIILPIALALDAQGTIFVLDRDLFRVRAITPYGINNRTFSSVSGANYAQAPVAAEAIISAFGTNLATATWPAPQLPLPTWLGGTTVKVKDSQGVERIAPLFYVSPTQVNYQIPKGTAAGLATITITSGDGKVSTGSVLVTSLAPGLFSATADGKGLAAAIVQRVKADGTQVYEQVVQFDAAQNKYVAIPIDLSNLNEQPYLLLFGTGLRARSSLANVQVAIDGVPCEVLYAGAQGAYVGLDQLNIKLPHRLAGRKEVEVTVVVDGKAANPVRVHVQ